MDEELLSEKLKRVKYLLHLLATKHVLASLSFQQSMRETVLRVLSLQN